MSTAIKVMDAIIYSSSPIFFFFCFSHLLRLKHGQNSYIQDRYIRCQTMLKTDTRHAGILQAEEEIPIIFSYTKASLHLCAADN